jgi:hypothetical protein
MKKQPPKVGTRKPPILIAYQGEELTIRQWSEKTGLYMGTISNRHAKGWSPERIFSTPQPHHEGHHKY